MRPSAASATRIVPQVASLTAAFLLIEQARAGQAASRLREAGQLLDLTVRELATLLGTTERTLARRLQANEALDKAESERLLLLLRLAEHGRAVFEDQGKFNRWLRRPLTLLSGQAPLALLDTASGFQVVDDLLSRLEYGVFS